MNCSKRLRDLREDHDLSQVELAKKTKINQTTLSFYERGDRVPTYENLIILADFYNVSVDYIMGRDMDNVEPINMPETVRIPVLGSIPAGIPIEAIEDIVDTIDIPKEWTENGQQYCALMVVGDSMQPEYLAGDTVIIKVQPDCNSGEDAIIYVNGYDATLKRVKKVGNRVILQPLNPKYEPKTYGPDDEDISILGVVKELRRKK